MARYGGGHGTDAGGSRFATMFAMKGILAIVGVLLVVLWGCGSGPSVTNDPLATLRDKDRPVRYRVEAARSAWARMLDGTGDRPATRRMLKDIAWDTGSPADVRIAAFKALLDDPDPAGLADARQLALLRLPTEPTIEVVGVLSRRASAEHWPGATGPLVRSLSRVVADVPDEDRPEYVALESLHPDRPVVQIAYGVFVDPPVSEAFTEDQAQEMQQRTRADAWDVLARLDPDGSVRSGLLMSEAGAVEAEGDRALSDLRACRADLGTVPLTGDELRWLSSLHDSANGANAKWWAQASRAISALDTEQRRGLRLRHAEPIRWAAAHRPEWVRASRSELLGILGKRLADRDVHMRRSRTGYRQLVPERLEEQADRLRWGDVLAMLVIDEALTQPDLVERLFKQAELDRRDTTTEYGGVIESAGDGFRVVLFVPRPKARRGDRQFVASADMIEQSDRSLAHFHFHVQEIGNAEYAGPSDGDRAYATRYGRSCVLLTSITRDTMDVDFYVTGDVVVDLGEVRR